MIMKVAGSATNVVPSRTVLQVEIRSTSNEFVPLMSEKIKKLVSGISQGFGTILKTSEITPFYRTYKQNRSIDSFIKSEFLEAGISPEDAGNALLIPSGSTDEANVSWVVPTGHIDFGIGYRGIPGHSDEFREASRPSAASKSLKIAIAATVKAVLKIRETNSITAIRKEFKEGA